MAVYRANLRQAIADRLWVQWADMLSRKASLRTDKNTGRHIGYAILLGDGLVIDDNRIGEMSRARQSPRGRDGVAEGCHADDDQALRAVCPGGLTQQRQLVETGAAGGEEKAEEYRVAA